MLQPTLVRSFVEDGFEAIPGIFLSDTAYGVALRRLCPGCTDIVIVNRSAKKIYLAERDQLPMQGLWWIGGAMSPSDSPQAAAAANFKRETSLSLEEERFTLVAVMDYQWKDRQQEPKMGCHMVVYTFAAELTPEELGAVNLATTPEYGQSRLLPYDRDALMKANVFPAILELYDHIFPEPAEVLYHTVLISVRPDTPQKTMTRVYNLYQTLAADCGGEDAGILYFALRKNLDMRKGVTWTQVAVFRDDAALQAFRAHPAHTGITDILRDIANWQVGDYMGPLMKL